jgi:hypothetical protein
LPLPFFKGAEQIVSGSEAGAARGDDFVGLGHRGARFGCLSLDLLIDANMYHRGGSRHGDLLQLRYSVARLRRE